MGVSCSLIRLEAHRAGRLWRTLTLTSLLNSTSSESSEFFFSPFLSCIGWFVHPWTASTLFFHGFSNYYLATVKGSLKLLKLCLNFDLPNFSSDCQKVFLSLTLESFNVMGNKLYLLRLDNAYWLVTLVYIIYL